MQQQSHTEFKWLKTFVIGGQPRDRAFFCYSAASDRLGVEPLGAVDELTPSELAGADAFFVGSDAGIFEQLRTRLASAGSFAPIIAFAAQPTVDEVIQAFEAGADSFIEAPFTPERLAEAIEAAGRKSNFLGTHSQRALAASMRLKCLSPREREVLEALADGLSNKVIALRLSISPRTVEIHRANAYAKLGLSHSAEAIRLVLEANFYHTLCSRSATQVS